MSKTLLFGVIALFMVIIEIPLGIFVHPGAELISIVWEKTFTYVVTVLTVLISIPMVFSLFFAVFSLIMYRSSKRSVYDHVGLTATILSMMVCAVGITLYVLSFFA